MLSVEVIDTGASFERFAHVLGERLSGIAGAAAAETVALAQSAIRTGVRSGRLYRLAGGRWHRASAPGEPPANRSGRLAASFAIVPVPGEDARMVANEAAYAIYLEEGTARMEPRPFLGPAFDAAVAGLDNFIEPLFDEAFGAVTGP